MVSTVALFGNSSNFILNSAFATPKIFSAPARFVGFKLVASLQEDANQKLPSIVLDSLRVLEWDKVCDSVASFAGTSLGKKATKEQLWSLSKTYEDSLRLLKETDAVVEMHKYGAMMELVGIDAVLVKSGLQCARRGFPVSGSEAMAIVTLLQFAEALQLNMKAALKDDQDCYQRFMPLSEMILELAINRSLVKYIFQLIDEDGSVKDSASSSLKQARDHVRLLERKLQQLMENLIRNQMRDISALEVSNVDGRWCIASRTNTRSSVEGLLLSSGSGVGSVLEPLSAVPLNDELQHARAAVAKAEADVLLKITNKMQMDLDNVENIFENMIQLDVINARAKYSISFGGSFPELLLPQEMDYCLPNGSLSEDGTSLASVPTQMNWSLYLPKACHPLLVQQHRQKLQKAKKDLNDATAEIRRRKQQGGSMSMNQEVDFSISSLEMRFEEIKQSPPVPINVLVSKNIRVAVITGPNTGGKTILLKTVGLAAMMAKSGLYVLSSEPVMIPWCDFVFADIGDEQSLSQSLSTFSGHLKQISKILSHSTRRSLVLLDEVGAGTNPLEGAALGMALLESFAEAGPLLTMATTHHGELKTLKYSNGVFENACMEFDEVNLKPTFRILWGVPGRSNAINIAQRLGLPNAILDGARELYGAASAEINEIILDMERFKQNFHKKIQEAERYLMLSKDLYQQLILANRRVTEYGIIQRNEMMNEITKVAAAARSALHEKLRQQRVFATQGPQHKHRPTAVNKNEHALMPAHPNDITARKETSRSIGESESSETSPGIRSATPTKRKKIPKEGDVVQVPSLNQKAVVLKVEPSKEEILVQAGRMKLKLKLVDVLN